jgi:hypothetical protein
MSLFGRTGRVLLVAPDSSPEEAAKRAESEFNTIGFPSAHFVGFGRPIDRPLSFTKSSQVRYLFLHFHFYDCSTEGGVLNNF